MCPVHTLIAPHCSKSKKFVAYRSPFGTAGVLVNVKQGWTVERFAAHVPTSLDIDVDF